MEMNLRIRLIDETQTGINQANGNTWVRKEFVAQELPKHVKDESMSTFVFTTFNRDFVKVLEECKEGDIVRVTFTTFVNGHTFTRQDGSEGVIRNISASIGAMEKVTDNVEPFGY